MYECNLYSISEETSVSDVLRTHLFVFLTGAIRILICIQGYPYLKPNLIQNVKTNTILVISVNSVYVDWKTLESSQHYRSQARVKEQGCGRFSESA